MKKQTKEELQCFLVALLVVGVVVGIPAGIIVYSLQDKSEIEPLPRWFCEQIDCGTQLNAVTFSGDPLFFRLKNCRTIGCRRVEQNFSYEEWKGVPNKYKNVYIKDNTIFYEKNEEGETNE